MPDTPIALFWFRRDLRLDDNTGLYYALRDTLPVLPVFVFDTTILSKLEDPADARVTFIHQRLQQLKQELESQGSTLRVFQGEPLAIWQTLLEHYTVKAVYTNRDYEPYARERDSAVETLLRERGVPFYTFKDQVIFEKSEVVPPSGGPFYKVFTPYSKLWRKQLQNTQLTVQPHAHSLHNWATHPPSDLPALESLGFAPSPLPLPKTALDTEVVQKYQQQRDFPALNGTTRLGLHLRFGTVGIRKLVQQAQALSDTYLNELIWREFYQMILWHNPQVVNKAFKPQYDTIAWRNDPEGFERWCQGNTGYPIVDAGMRELNATGHMHNRLRMITASFLTKHLLIDWRLGEAYFAKKLLDFELASNNGGWQWAAGTGTDAQPYFRIFNPYSQTDKFDKALHYTKKWVPELGTPEYATPIIDHKAARERCLEVYKAAVKPGL